MFHRIVVTDVTRMQGERVCVAGYPMDDEGVEGCVRPELDHRPLVEGWLKVRGTVVVQPFAVIELDLLEHRPQPPHTEDWIVDERYRVRCGMLDPDHRLALLVGLDDSGVDRIFGAPIHHDHGWFVMIDEGERSLGTVRAGHDLWVTYAPRPNRGNWDYRLAFVDERGGRYNLSVTDLAFRYYLDYQRDREGVPAAQAAHRLGATLKRADDLFLRVGLGRGWGERKDRCHLQINGVYAFPDYLDGRCFADLAPVREFDLRDVPF